MTAASIATVRTAAELRHRLVEWRRDNVRIGFVPTMGALHRGHLELVRQARARTDRVVVSIFVNPIQFGPAEDLATYPRQEARDLDALSAQAADLAYLPDVNEIFPAGFATRVSVGGISDGLCGAARPGHFEGVATVVTKLLNQVQPDSAFFGEKDFQQLQVIRRLVADLGQPVDIESVATVREEDGLALSSRNAKLSTAGRAVASGLYRALERLAGEVAAGEEIAAAEARAGTELAAAGFERIDYVEVRLADTLSRPGRRWEPAQGAARAFGAALIEGVRLIDNVALPDRP
ncbi:MAG: pantoate--beta-alanine ligase [Alphaproteobacteria bacterium]